MILDASPSLPFYLFTHSLGMLTGVLVYARRQVQSPFLMDILSVKYLHQCIVHRSDICVSYYSF